MNILHINLADQARGAALAAFRLHKAQMKAGHDSRMLVGKKVKERPEIEMLPKRETAWQQRFFLFVNRFEEATGLQYLWQPWKKQFLRHPATQKAEVINLHNIHSGYFSHTILPEMSRRVPVVWTLHDLWSITGRCSFPYVHNCKRWKTGCGKCPSLSDYPRIAIDTTALLWRIKRQIYRNSDLMIVTPSEWMADIVRESPLLNRFDIHCIPHGLDTKVFKPVPKPAARKALRLPPEAKIVLFAAFDLFQERKGGVYLFDALQQLYDEGRKDLLLVTVGNEQKSLGKKYTFPIRALGHITNEKAMAQAFNAADVYAGPSLSEAFGLVYMEAMACATPVVAFRNTAVPEVVKHEDTGYLAKTKDADGLAHGLRWLLDDDGLRKKISRQCWERVEREYTLKLQAKRYVKLYREAIDKRSGSNRIGRQRTGDEVAQPSNSLPNG